MTIAPVPTPSRTRSERGSAAAWLLGLLVVGGLAFAVYWFVLRDDGAGGGASRLAASVVPAGADTVVGIDVGAVLTNADVAKLAETRGIDVAAIKAKLAEVGVKPEDLRSLVVAIDMPDAGAPEVVIAVELDADTKTAQGAVLALQAMLPEDLRDKIDLSRVEAFEGGLVLIGSGAFYDQAAQLARGQGTAPGLAAPLLEVRGAVDASAHLWIVAALPREVTERGLPGPLSRIMGNAKPTHAAGSVKVGANIDIKGAVRLEGGDTGKLADQLGGMIGLASLGAGKEIGDVLKGLEIGSQGASLTVSVSLTPAQLANMKNVKDLF